MATQRIKPFAVQKSRTAPLIPLFASFTRSYSLQYTRALNVIFFQIFC